MSLLREDDAAAGLAHLSGQSTHYPSAADAGIASAMQWQEEQGQVIEIAGMSRGTTEHSQKRQQPKRRRVSLNTSHPCNICGKTYDRVDHLNRHLKSHDNTRPFQCSKCPKGFNRPDLLRRHESTHGNDPNKVARRASSNRAVQACKACAASKSKCEDQKPCGRCQERRITCEYNQIKLPLRSSDHDDLIIEGLSTHRSDGSPTREQLGQRSMQENELYPDMSMQISVNRIDPQLRGQPEQHINPVPDNLHSLSVEHDIITPGAFPMPSNPVAFPNGFDPSFEIDWQENMLLPIDVANFGQDLDINFSNFDWDFNQYDGNILPTVMTNSSTDESGSVNLRHEAFKRTPWFWVPTTKDHAFAGQGEVLAINENSAVSSPDYILGANSRLVDERVDQAVRDKIFVIIIAESSRAAPVHAFPSADLLDNLLQIFWLRDSFQIDTWIHAATFKTSKAIPELLIGIISAGSTFISDPAIWKLGLALQEISRFAVATRLEKNNTKTRDLETLQAYMLWIDVGLWCGFNRIMEIAEAFEQPVLTMLRRSGALTRVRYPVIRPEAEDTGEVLETKWANWVKHESFKRLVLHLFIRDMQNSIANLVNPLISYTEMALPLPACRRLWKAKTAEDWKSVFLEIHPLPQGQTPSLVDSLQNIASFELYRDQIDAQLSGLAMVFGHWGQIWSYNETRRFFLKGWKAAGQLRLTSQQQELAQNLGSFCSKLELVTEMLHETALLTQLLMMSLYVSIEDLQRFAGKSGEEEARRTYPILRDWIESSDSRHAAWHAGQVVRAARGFPPTQLRGFYAIALYHASLTLWAYGLASRAARKRGMTGTSTPIRPAMATTQPIRILLDGIESREARAFLHFGQGDPGLTILPSSSVDIVEPGFASVEDSKSLMATARHVSRNNFPLSDEPLPPLVENIGNLMKDLGDLATVPNLRGAQTGL